jgi:hypothetical protein
LPFFHIFQIISLFSSIFPLSFRYFLLYFPNLFTIRLTYLPYFRNHFTIQLIFPPYFSMFSSYQKQALTVMISPLCTNGHDIINIVECGIKHHQPNPLFTNSNDKQHNDQKIPKE